MPEKKPPAPPPEPEVDIDTGWPETIELENVLEHAAITGGSTRRLTFREPKAGDLWSFPGSEDNQDIGAFLALAARMAGVPPNAFKGLAGGDIGAVVQVAQRALISAGFRAE